MGPIQLGIHALQSLIAVVILGCSIGKVTTSSTAGFGLAIFTAIATILVGVYIFTASFIAKSLYKVWLIVGLNCITAIFWIATVGEIAAQTSRHCTSNGHNHCYRKRYENDNHGLEGATIALSVIDGLLSIASIGYTVYQKRNRRTQTPAAEEFRP
ncbi:hypothetical protein ASPWEDRAFT_71912 [Aspergillus wentii DTO 134E9]|uniref:MARVEL domain-containing protein n=1 Tax=Aspergillus wentii DTO 134E9 TaxID=1073089 RepID=A0A1L9R7H4_ASPWE|nr:uncharacterized protein ASPWEDRAFT_71912 [Aspergillus wentii DTO 134E9]OJJ30854.1 hypothetical protein ASPWEDRAFT_71912 [Aspergillus wentii DTO 134E9]